MKYPLLRFIMYLAVLSLLFASAAVAQRNDAAFEEEGVQALRMSPEGNLVEFEDELRPDRFIFYTWLEAQPDGISLTADVLREPSDDEREEYAPSRTQNLAVGYVGYRGDDDLIYPVAGAQVRWIIDEGGDDAQGSTFFGAVDAAGPTSLPGGYGVVTEKMAVTLTNNGNIRNRARFPSSSGDFPLYNATGVTSPDTSGMTWVTLFSPDERASARVIAVAMVNGVEVGKQIVHKNFAPAPELELEKTVSTQSINLMGDESGTVTFEVTVRNTGGGDAQNVVLEDSLTSGNSDAFEFDADSLPGEADANGDSFTHTFDLAAGEERTFTFDATASATDTYCNTARITEFENEQGDTRRSQLSDRACFEVIRPELSIVKDFIDSNGESLGDNVTVAANEEATLRVRVINRGSGPAENVTLTDELTEGNAEAYAIVQQPEGVQADGDDAFTADIGTLEPDESVEYTYPVSASEDGRYCDVARISVDGEERGEDQACLEVATPNLEIEKDNEPSEVLPGSSYTSTITVTNTGNAVARGVVVSDTIATSEDDSTTLDYTTSSFANREGRFEAAEGRVTAPESVDIEPGESVEYTVTTQVPARTGQDTFCNVAAYQSDNAGEGEAEACIEVPAFAALQTRLIDDEDPVVTGGELMYTATIYNEPRSNEAIADISIDFTFGSAEDEGGNFQIDDTTVYLVNNPDRNPETGGLRSGPTDGQQLSPDEDFTLGEASGGQRNVTLNFNLGPDTAIFVVHDVTVPEGTATGSYNSQFEFTGTGVDSGTQYNPRASEPTTVIAP